MQKIIKFYPTVFDNTYKTFRATSGHFEHNFLKTRLYQKNPIRSIISQYATASNFIQKLKQKNLEYLKKHLKRQVFQAHFSPFWHKNLRKVIPKGRSFTCQSISFYWTSGPNLNSHWYLYLQL